MQSLQFQISGRVYEQESGLGVPGLMIRAYDKDMLYDDLLGTAITDVNGCFELRYAESDFCELFELKPDIYLSIYVPPDRFLIDTRDAIRWNADREETFEISISRNILGDSSPTLPDNQVEAGISLPKDLLKIKKRDGFDVPHLPGFSTGGVPGAPAVPCQMRYVALPLGADVLELQVIPGEAVRLDGPFNAFPAQIPFADRDIPIEENIHFQMTAPDPKYFEGQVPYPSSLAEVVQVEEVGPLRIVSVQVRPVQYDPVARSYVYYPNLKYVVTFDRAKAQIVADERRAAGVKVGELQAEYLSGFLQFNSVSVARWINWPDWPDFSFLEKTPHLIITDNYEWPHESIPSGNGATRPPKIVERGKALGGNLVKEFQQLADWRNLQGFRSKVVSISQIIDGTYGDFTQGGFARDLPEVIRNFLKHAHANWDTRYVVLGGDVNVVPMRRLIGMGPQIIDIGFGVLRTPEKIPEKYQCHFLEGYSASKLHPDPKYCNPQSTDILCTHHSAKIVPYNRHAGPDNLGWYYTTAADFNNPDLPNQNNWFTRLADNNPTEFIIVEGPEADIDDDFYWVLEGNSIPSDFYYASLVGEGYSVPGKHDFDNNNNSLYGQSYSSYDDDATECLRQSYSSYDAFKKRCLIMLDKVDLFPDVWVGRVPAESGAEVRVFVDKVITYEDLKSPNSPSVNVDPNYLRKVLYAADYWYWERYYQDHQKNINSPPAEGWFTHVNGTTVTKICIQFDLKNPAADLENIFLLISHRLVGVTGSQQTVIPWKYEFANEPEAWFFYCSDDTYTTESPSPTRFIKVEGTEEASVNYTQFFWDPIGLELATEEKERLRKMMSKDFFPQFNNVQRHYLDYFDLTAPPPLIPLEANSLRNAINSGQHFVSLSGHGGSKGCCKIDATAAPFTNKHQYFIAFANACYTAQPDGPNDSLGKVLVLSPESGAVAYIGFSRMGFVRYGDDYEDVFWCLLGGSDRIGPALVREAGGGINDFWMHYALTLYGDPAMRIWNHVPKVLEIKHRESFQSRHSFPVTVHYRGTPVGDARVTLMGGEGKDAVFLSKKTNPEGLANFILPDTADRLKTLNVTIWSREGRLYRGTVQKGREIP